MVGRWIPYINWSHPPEERDAKRHVWTQIALLRYHLHNFRNAVSLTDHCHTLNEQHWLEAAGNEPEDELAKRLANSVHWVHLAGRDAVMTVYHFGQTLSALKRNARHPPSLKAVDGEALKRAWKRFLGSFPMYEQHRHAVSHLADDMSTHEKRAALTPDDGNIIAGQIHGRAYVVRYKGREMSLSVSEETFRELEAIMADAWEAFRPVEEAELASAGQRS